MGDSSIEVTDENRDASQEAKAQAVEAISEGININIASTCDNAFGEWCDLLIWLGNVVGLCDSDKLEEAIEHLTEAILLNPTSAIMYATRGVVSFFTSSVSVLILIGCLIICGPIVKC